LQQEDEAEAEAEVEVAFSQETKARGTSEMVHMIRDHKANVKVEAKQEALTNIRPEEAKAEEEVEEGSIITETLGISSIGSKECKSLLQQEIHKRWLIWLIIQRFMMSSCSIMMSQLSNRISHPKLNLEKGFIENIGVSNNMIDGHVTLC
jgi:hypothetical protein